MQKQYLFYFSPRNESFVSFLVPNQLKKHLIFGKFVAQADPESNFWNLSLGQIKKIKKTGKFIVLDSMFEGFSTLYDKPSLSQIYEQCEIHSISPNKIIYITMNLLEAQNVEDYANKHQLPKIQVLNLPFSHVDTLDNSGVLRIDALLTETKEQFKKNFNGKILLNLNNRYRQPRSTLSFYLATSPIKEYCLISHNEKYRKEYEDKWVHLPDRTQKQEKNWSKKTPIVLDGQIHINYKFYQSTVFEVVGETLTQNWWGTSKEYSEKSFKPIVNFQPFLIYGQKGCNHNLEKLGYQTYHDWFDLSFDFIDDEIERLLCLYQSVEQTTIMLSKMSTHDKAEWRFKNRSVLEHNHRQFFKNLQNIKQTTETFFEKAVQVK